MAARIEAVPHKVKRDSGSARGSGLPPRRRVVTDFAFDLNHIKDVFDSDMVSVAIFRYVRRHSGGCDNDWWQDTCCERIG